MRDHVKRYRVPLCCLLAALLPCAYEAGAWGPLTHAYLALQVFPAAPPQLLFGAMAADMNECTPWTASIAGRFKHYTHFEAALLRPSPFRLGLLSHNSDWGGDSYAHAYFHEPTDKLYPMSVFRQLSGEMNISMNEAEDLVETVMDYVIARDLGAPFLHRLDGAARSCGDAEEQALVDAFAAPLAHDKPELSLPQVQEIVRDAFRADKTLLAGTVDLMGMPDASLRGIAPVLLAAGSGAPVAFAAQCFERAVELCADWRIHLDGIAQAMAGEFQSRHIE